MSKQILVFILMGIYHCAHTQAPFIQCPQYFQYLQLGSTYVGRITLPNIVPGRTKVYVEFSQRENFLTPNYYGNLGLYEDKQTTINKIYSGQPILYRVDFPTPNVLPKLTLLSVNDAVICADSQYPPPSSTLRLTHILNAQYFSGSYINPIKVGQPKISTNVLAPTTPQRKPNTVQQTQPINVQNNAKCGLENRVIQPYIIGGELLSPHQYPWLVAIFKSTKGNFKFICGGTLVSSRTVISAAHCFENFKTGIIVQLGRYNLEDYSETFETRSVRSLITHPEFRFNSLWDADIAILHLNAAVSFSRSIRPACLWNEQIDVNLLVGQRATVAGWGQNEMRQQQSKPKWANANIVSSTECQRALINNLVTPNARAICVRSLDGSKPCYGDSGGGLVVLRNGRWILRGVVSGGYATDRDCLRGFTFFCDLAKHRTWLLKNII